MFDKLKEKHAQREKNRIARSASQQTFSLYELEKKARDRVDMTWDELDALNRARARDVVNEVLRVFGFLVILFLAVAITVTAVRVLDPINAYVSKIYGCNMEGWVTAEGNIDYERYIFPQMTVWSVYVILFLMMILFDLLALYVGAVVLGDIIKLIRRFGRGTSKVVAGIVETADASTKSAMAADTDAKINEDAIPAKAKKPKKVRKSKEDDDDEAEIQKAIADAKAILDREDIPEEKPQPKIEPVTVESVREAAKKEEPAKPFASASDDELNKLLSGK
jgi:hypothetical protein